MAEKMMGYGLLFKMYFLELKYIIFTPFVYSLLIFNILLFAFIGTGIITTLVVLIFCSGYAVGRVQSSLYYALLHAQGKIDMSKYIKEMDQANRKKDENSNSND
jgi:uncharacterized membrane protein YciS (DUF1049 family)